MERKSIDDAIKSIMMMDGPDRHVDGHEVITDFVVALLNGRGESWIAAYKQDADRQRSHAEEIDRAIALQSCVDENLSDFPHHLPAREADERRNRMSLD